MTKTIKAALIAATMISGVAVTGAANAVVNFSFTPGVSVAPSATLIESFNGATVVGLTGTNYVLHAGSPNDGQGAAPNSSGTQYLAVLANGSATYTFATAVQGFQFDWGTASIDNVLTVYTTDNTAGQTFTVPGSDIPNGVNYNKNGLLNAVSTTTKITGFKLTAATNSFEIDSVAAVPEPATWAMMVLGFGLVGAAARSRRTSVTFA